jgi:hypothetical protein
VIGDETYLLALSHIVFPRLKKVPFTMIFDFVGADAVTRNPLERLQAYLLNRTMCGGPSGKPFPFDLTLFIGEPQDVADRAFGPGLPNRRYLDRVRVRARLGYHERRVVLCSVGGTAVADPLLRPWPPIHG